MKVLLIDDLDENISALMNLLETEQDIEFYTASCAEEALAHLLEHDFALALLDVQMPRINGFELAKIIRSVKRHKNLPIIFLTAMKEEEATIHQGYGSGAVDVLFKPLDPDVVRSKVRIFIQLAKQSAMLKDQMRELEELRAQADEANLAKGRFLANMSHEIRTPLGVVMGFADILASDSNIAQPVRDKYAESIKRNGQLLLKLIDDVLDLSRIEAGKVELENAAFFLEDLVKDLNTTMSLKAEQKQLTLTCRNIAGNRAIYGDLSRIKQILLNLLGNAVKFTEKGSVDLEILLNSENRLEFRVKDSGVGLAPHEIDKLFKRFSQADASTKKKFGGSGLGLMISKQLANAMHGDLDIVSSTPGEGTTFLFWIPFVPAKEFVVMNEAETRARNVDFLNGKKILFVDDSKDNHELLRHIFATTKASLDCVSSGPECLSRLKENEYDCCLMDVQMPEMDGIETTKIARESGFQKPIIALTAYAGLAERQKCLDAGCNNVVTKPIDSLRLFDHLHLALS